MRVEGELCACTCANLQEHRRKVGAGREARVLDGVSLLGTLCMHVLERARRRLHGLSKSRVQRLALVGSWRGSWLAGRDSNADSIAEPVDRSLVLKALWPASILIVHWS